jgi:hypothetical protein
VRIAGTCFVPGADEGIDEGAGTDVAWEMGVWEEVFPCAYLEVPVAAGNNPFPVPTLLFILSHYYHAVSCAW